MSNPSMICSSRAGLSEGLRCGLLMRLKPVGTKSGVGTHVESR